MSINVNHVYPPIPDRRFDYCATWAGWDLGDPQGWGPDPGSAVQDLLANSEGDREEADHLQTHIDNLCKAIAPILTGFAWEVLTEEQQGVLWRGMFAADSVWRHFVKTDAKSSPEKAESSK